jgi:hypothetical protein
LRVIWSKIARLSSLDNKEVVAMAAVAAAGRRREWLWEMEGFSRRIKPARHIAMLQSACARSEETWH